MEANLDSALIEIIEQDADVHGNKALVWCPVTPEASKVFGDAYFISNSFDHEFTGCKPIGTVGQVKASIKRLKSSDLGGRNHTFAQNKQTDLEVELV